MGILPVVRVAGTSGGLRVFLGSATRMRSVALLGMPKGRPQNSTGTMVILTSFIGLLQ
jgi:hypothetical protein